MRLAVFAIVTLCSALPGALAADDLAAVKESAVKLYDQGAYEEARSSLEQLDAAKALDGPLLYRLFFCEKAAGHTDDAAKVLERARAALEAEIPAARSLEDSFYLANAYQNLGRANDAKEIARDVTARIESKKMPIPASAIGQFQVGKLYQDQGRAKEAATYYGKAVDGFDLKSGRYAGSARWALRYLGNQAFADSDFEASDAALTKLVTMGGPDPSDWFALAAARTRLGKYAGAGDAWRAAVKLDPNNADDPRYAARLADVAAALGKLPAEAPEGKAFGSLTQPELEALLKAQAAAVAASMKRAAEGMKANDEGKPTQALDPKLRTEVVQALAKTRGVFVAAGLEYAIRRYPIRETAFREGYAMLIFQDAAWEVPPDPEKAAS